MTASLADALSADQILHVNALGTVTRNCVILTIAGGQRQTIISLSSVSRLRRVTVSYPILLVLAAATLLVAAGASYSKEGNGAGIPIAVFGAFLLVNYWASRRGGVTFSAGSERVESALGSPSEAAALIAAIQGARKVYLSAEEWAEGTSS